MDQQILSGYRIGVLRETSLYEVALATSVGASAVHIYKGAHLCTSQAEFEMYLASEMQSAKDEGETLVVLRDRYGLRTRYCSFLDQIEEKEFYGAEKENGCRLIFTTTKCLNEAIRGDSDGGYLYDSWHDVVERGSFPS